MSDHLTADALASQTSSEDLAQRSARFTSGGPIGLKMLTARRVA
jgi:hypothetical protein